ncbi:MAG: protein kinase [Planctomycetaceae bacterium]|nr:protein kinase [Planctomycetaceae bacterium]
MNQTSWQDNTSEPPNDWDVFLARRLEELESTLRSGGHRPSFQPEELGDCPPDVVSELQELQSTLLKVESFLGKRDNVRSPVITNPDSEPSTLPLENGGTDTTPVPGLMQTSEPYSDLRLGRFELGQKLGDGTYGIVYLAQDPRLKRLVALKIPRLDAAFRDDLRERFVREGESAARLTHPNIVTVYEALSEGPVTFIASEYISGPNLATWLEDHPEPVAMDVAARLIADLAEAVSHAHARQVLHRDIKPSNVLLAPKVELPKSLEDYVPKLTDFGLAKLLETQDATLSGAIVGTPAYMPPEQIAGKSNEIGPAVDVYALGMVLYQLLTGACPFLKQNIGETIHAVTSEVLPKPSKLRRGISRDLETICLKSLRRDQSERYASAEELAADLERYLGGHPIRARDVSAFERAIKWTRRYPALTIATLSSFSLLIAMLTISTLQNARVQNALDEAEGQRRKAEERELRLLRRTYLDDMQVAGEAWNNNHTGIAIDILQRYVPEPSEPDVRDFAWWAIWNEYHDNSRIIGTHEGGATAVACTSMAPYAAFTGGQDATIKIWSIPDGKQIGEMRGHTEGPIQSLELSPDETLLLSSAEDGTVRIWDVKSRTEKLVFREHTGWVATARFSPDGTMVASAGEDQVIRIWDVETGEELRTLKGHTDTVRAVGFHPDHKKNVLVSSSHDKTVRIWDYVMGIPWNVNEKVPGGILPVKTPAWGRAVEFDGQNVLVASVGVWNISAEDENRGTQTFSFPDLDPPLPRIRSVDRLLDGRSIWGMQDSSLRIMIDNEQIPEEKASRVLLGHISQEVMDVALFPNDEGFISVGSNGEIRIWSSATLKPTIWIQDRADSSPDKLFCHGNTVEYSLRNGSSSSHYIGGSDATTGERQWEAKVPTKDHASFTFATHPDRTHAWIWHKDKLTSLSISDDVPLWTKQGDELKELEDQEEANGTRFMEFDPTGKYAALFKGTLGLILDAQSGNVLTRISIPRSVSRIAFLRNHHMLIVASGDGILRNWDLESLNSRPTIERQIDPTDLSDMSLSKDEAFVALRTSTRHLLILTFPEFKEVCQIAQRADENIHRIFLVDNGETLVTVPGSQDRFDFWNVRSQRKYLSFILEHERLMEVSFDRTKFALGSEHGVRFIDGGPRSSETHQ